MHVPYFWRIFFLYSNECINGIPHFLYVFVSMNKHKIAASFKKWYWVNRKSDMKYIATGGLCQWLISIAL